MRIKLPKAKVSKPTKFESAHEIPALQPCARLCPRTSSFNLIERGELLLLLTARCLHQLVMGIEDSTKMKMLVVFFRDVLPQPRRTLCPVAIIYIVSILRQASLSCNTDDKCNTDFSSNHDQDDEGQDGPQVEESYSTPPCAPHGSMRAIQR